MGRRRIIPHHRPAQIAAKQLHRLRPAEQPHRRHLAQTALAAKTDAPPQITARQLRLGHLRKRADDDEASILRQLRQLRQRNEAAAPAVARAQIRLLQPHQIKSDAEQTVRRENPQLARIGKLHHRITLHLRRSRADVAPIARQRRLHPLQIPLRRRALADGIAQLPRRRDIRRPALLRRLIAAIKQHIDHRHTRRIDLAQMRVEKIVHHPRKRQLRQQLAVRAVTLAQIHHRRRLHRVAHPHRINPLVAHRQRRKTHRGQAGGERPVRRNHPFSGKQRQRTRRQQRKKDRPHTTATRCLPSG